MADFTLTAAPVLGVNISIGKNRIHERGDLALVSVAVPQNGEAALAAALQAAWNLAMPQPRQTSAAGDMRAMRSSPDLMMLIFPHPEPDAESVVQGALGGTGYTTDQSDVWVVLELSGPQIYDALERLCPLDMDATAFPEGAAARTMIEHMGALIVRLEPERFWLMSASSSARSFLHAVETSCRYVI